MRFHGADLQKGDAIAIYNDKWYNLISIFITFVSHPIKFFTKGFWNIPHHIAIYMGDEKITEALFFKGFVEANIHKYDAFKITAHRVKDITPQQQNGIVEYANSKIGRPYDYGAILGYITFPLFRLFGFPNPFEEQSNLYCSEAYAEAVKQETGKLFGKETGYIPPVDIAYSPIMEKL